MGALDSYKVDLKGISASKTAYNWHVDADFFSAVQGTEITSGCLDVELEVRKWAEAYELMFHIEGDVTVLCDRCLEPMDIPVMADVVLKAKLGDQYEDDGDMITVPYDEGCINVAWHIYELAALEIPIRHVHPDGECIGYSAEEEPEEEPQETQTSVDPRWDDLRKILNNKIKN